MNNCWINDYRKIFLYDYDSVYVEKYIIYVKCVKL